MNKYKVEIVVERTYEVDVLAKNSDEAIIDAVTKWDGIVKQGMEHYHENGDAVTQVSSVYDVTNTDDPFNP